jgi:uncharacterized protein
MGVFEMFITNAEVEILFHHLETGEKELFFRNVSDDVNWKVMGTHPLAGTYTSKQEFITSTFDRLDRLMKNTTNLKVKHASVQGESAAVDLEAVYTALNGMPFNGTYLLGC